MKLPRHKGILQTGLAAMAIISMTAPGSVLAQQNRNILSTYTKWNIETCHIIEKDEVSKVHSCPGKAGIVIKLFNDPDSLTLSFGKEENTRAEIAGKITSEWHWESSFIFAKNTVEWRGYKARSGTTPFAAIVRYDIGKGVGGPFRQKLVVYRIQNDRISCIAAKIDAHQPNANQLARDAADKAGASFRCGIDAFKQ